MATSLTVFADTNIFLQCKPLQDLPWSDVGEFDEINVVIPPTVLDEIDDHSHGGSDRRAKRARSVLPLIDRINKSPTHIHVIREKTPRITIALGGHPPKGAQMPYPLRESKRDHCILFESLCLTEVTPASSLFLAIDRAAIALANNLGLKHFQAPEEWRLPPETTDQEKRIKVLESEIKALQATHPVLELRILDKNGRPLGGAHDAANDLVEWSPKTSLIVIMQLYPKLDSAQIKEIVSLAKTIYPIQADLSLQPPEPSRLPLVAFNAFHDRRWVPPSEEAIAQYRDKDYPAWASNVEFWAAHIADDLNRAANLALLNFALANTGGVPAESTVLSIDISPIGLIFDAPDKSKNPKGPPSPPAAPHGHYESLYDRILRIGTNYTSARIVNRPWKMPDLSRTRHDPHAFYYHPSKPNWPTTAYEFICDAFRHKIGPEVFTLVICAPSDENRPNNGALHIQVTADNLPKPLQLTIPINVNYERLDTFQKVKEMLMHPAIDAVADDDTDL